MRRAAPAVLVGVLALRGGALAAAQSGAADPHAAHRAAAAAAAQATAGQHAGHHAAAAAGETAPAAPAQERTRLDIPDVPVLDQEGRRLHFVSDLVAGRLVAIHFIFTNCTTICPPLAATFGSLRKLLGERAGRDVFLISVSVDPTTDTPARLKAWAAKFGSGPGWTLVTGDRDDVTRLLKALGAYTADLNDHPPLVLIGNQRGEWTRAYGLAAPKKIAAVIDAMAVPASAPAEAARP
jgi:protein SCO1/2